MSTLKDKEVKYRWHEYVNNYYWENKDKQESLRVPHVDSIASWWLTEITKAREENFSAGAVNIAFENGKKKGREELKEELRTLFDLSSINEKE